MNVNAAILENETLIDSLCDSFSRQLALYTSLGDLTQRIMSRMVLSRGDLSGVAEAFEQKNELLSRIESERIASRPLVELWQERKETLRSSAAAEKLDCMLDKMQRAVGVFLDAEEQLQTRIEHAVSPRAQL